MATCEEKVGVKNLLITFKDCDTEEVIGPISHKLASEELPTVKTCDTANTALTAGYVQIVQDNPSMTLNIIRDKRVPLAWYQGCASLDVQIEYYNGLVYTGLSGTVTEPEESDTHSVSMTTIFKQIDEMLPPGSLADAA